jgi:predicted RNase H-like HicB family nuclease
MSVDAQGRRFHYTVLFERAEEGGYVAHVPALPGLWTQGETLAETRAMAREAILGYIEGLVKSGEPIPPDGPPKKPRREVLEVAVPA